MAKKTSEKKKFQKLVSEKIREKMHEFGKKDPKHRKAAIAAGFEEAREARAKRKKK